MTIAARRHIAFERLYNFRDLGGYPTADGRQVRWGLLYRSDSLGKLAGNDLDQFAAIGIRTVIDLRHSWEIDKRGRVPEAAELEYHNYSIEHRPYDQSKLSDVVDPVTFLADRYAEVASDGRAEIGQTLRVIAAAGSAPLVVHCASGKDRTGIIAALVLSLLGVAEDDIVADFALTGLATRAANRRLACRLSGTTTAVAALRHRACGADASVPRRAGRDVRLGTRVRHGLPRHRGWSHL